MGLDGSIASVDDSLSYFSRSVLWKIYMGVLPLPYAGTSRETVVDGWAEKLYERRAWYAVHRQQLLECYPVFTFVSNKDGAKPEEETFSSFLPGVMRSSAMPSVLEEGPEEVKDDIISMDIRRTYVSADFDVPHHILFMVLAMWRWTNPVIGYQQGMHELAGNLLLMLKRASASIPLNAPVAIRECANSRYLEADTYVLFEALMSDVGMDELFEASSVVGRGPASAIGHQLTTLESLCHHTVFELMKDHSPQLYNHFANTNMFDQLLLFLPRWMRNMFTRELSRPQVFTVWDGLLAVHFNNVVLSSVDVPVASRSLLQSLRMSLPFAAQESTKNGSYSSTAKYVGDSKSSTAEAKSEEGRQRIGAFFRTLAGIAVELLLYTEDELMEIDEAFYQLKRLTKTPLIPGEADAARLLFKGTKIARTRPQGIVLKEASTPGHADGDEGPRRRQSRHTKEELLTQQTSAALVIRAVTARMATLLGPDVPGEKALTLSPDNIRLLKGGLVELDHLAAKLGE